MSSFDAIASKAINSALSVFGDIATYRYSSGGSVSGISVICNLDAVEAGSIHEIRTRSLTLKIKKSLINRPITGDRITISSGQHAGDYVVYGIDDEDDYTYWVVVS